MEIEGLKRIKVKVCKIKKYYFENNKKKTKMVNNIDTYGREFALIQDEYKNTFVFNTSNILHSISKDNIKQIEKGKSYVFYTFKNNRNSYLNVEYIINLNDKLEVENLPLNNEIIPKRVFEFMESIGRYKNNINFNDLKLINSLRGFNQEEIIWLLENMNIKNDVLKYCYVFKWLNEICKKTSYNGTNANKIIEIYNDKISSIFDDTIDVESILHKLCDMNIICKSHNIEGNYFPEYFCN